MRTIKNNSEKMIEIKNSKFISILIKICNSNIDTFLNEIKSKYPKATHYCYGYICGDDKKSSDDGEPSGTAGMPILNVLEKEDLNYVLAVTVRYFGGIKLGAGGLVRAYTKSITEALKEAEYIELEKGLKVEISFPYTEEKNINYILKDFEIIEKKYGENITYTVLITKDIEEKLNKYNLIVLEELYIEKKNS